MNTFNTFFQRAAGHLNGNNANGLNSASSLNRTLLACTLAAACGLAACDNRAASNPGSTPASVGGNSTSGGTGNDGASIGVGKTAPAAPDARGGGSAGAKGMPEVPDASGAPTSPGPNTGGQGKVATPASGNSAGQLPAAGPEGSAATGADVRNQSAAQSPGTRSAGQTQQAPASTPRPPDTVTNKGLPASDIGKSGGTQGNSNSTPNSNTGNM